MVISPVMVPRWKIACRISSPSRSEGNISRPPRGGVERRAGVVQLRSGGCWRRSSGRRRAPKRRRLRAVFPTAVPFPCPRGRRGAGHRRAAIPVRLPDPSGRFCWRSGCGIGQAGGRGARRRGRRHRTLAGRFARGRHWRRYVRCPCARPCRRSCAGPPYR